LKKQQERGLMALANFDVVAGMLLGMLAFEPQRARTVEDRSDRFVSAIRLGAYDDNDVEAALSKVLFACAEPLLANEVIALQRMVIATSDRFPEIVKTFHDKALRPTVATLAIWLGKLKQRGLIRPAAPNVIAGMLRGMLAFEPKRAVLFGQEPVPARKLIEGRARDCAALFLRGARPALTSTPAAHT
jgi:AcrR family transcriptional regulator